MIDTTCSASRARTRHAEPPPHTHDRQPTPTIDRKRPLACANFALPSTIHSTPSRLILLGCTVRATHSPHAHIHASIRRRSALSDRSFDRLSPMMRISISGRPRITSRTPSSSRGAGGLCIDRCLFGTSNTWGSGLASACRPSSAYFASAVTAHAETMRRAASATLLASRARDTQSSPQRFSVWSSPPASAHIWSCLPAHRDQAGRVGAMSSTATYRSGSRPVVYPISNRPLSSALTTANRPCAADSGTQLAIEVKTDSTSRATCARSARSYPHPASVPALNCGQLAVFRCKSRSIIGLRKCHI